MWSRHGLIRRHRPDSNELIRIQFDLIWHFLASAAPLSSHVFYFTHTVFASIAATIVEMSRCSVHWYTFWLNPSKCQRSHQFNGVLTSLVATLLTILFSLHCLYSSSSVTHVTADSTRVHAIYSHRWDIPTGDKTVRAHAANGGGNVENVWGRRIFLFEWMRNKNDMKNSLFLFISFGVIFLFDFWSNKCWLLFNSFLCFIFFFFAYFSVLHIKSVFVRWILRLLLFSFLFVKMDVFAHFGLSSEFICNPMWLWM